MDSLEAERGATATVPMAVLADTRLACNTKVALSLMAGYSANGIVTVSQAEIARVMGVKPPSLSEALQPAVEAGLIERVKRGGVLTWRLTWHQAEPNADKAEPNSSSAEPNSSRTGARTRVSSSPSTSTRVISLSIEDTAKVHARYDRTLGAAMVTNQIALALDYATGRGIYRDTYRMVMNWLIKPERETTLHEVRLATEKARLERARAPYGPAVTAEPPKLKFTNIDDISPPKPYDVALGRWKHENPDRWPNDPTSEEIQPYLAALGVAS